MGSTYGLRSRIARRNVRDASSSSFWRVSFKIRSTQFRYSVREEFLVSLTREPRVLRRDVEVGLRECRRNVRQQHAEEVPEWWHPLVSGDPKTMHSAGISVRGRTLPESAVGDDELQTRVIRWIKTAPLRRRR